MAMTNILQISGFSQIPYRIFILPPTNTKSTSNSTSIANDLRRAQIALLRRGELANEKNGELWTFSRDGVQPAPVPEESNGLQETSTGTLFASQLLPPNESPPQNASTQSLRNGAAHRNFLSAVRALTEYRFLQLPGYNILGGWLVAPAEMDAGNEDFRALLPALQSPSRGRDLFRLSVNLAANGDLYITPERNPNISAQDLSPGQAPLESSTVFLSPSGKQAEFLSLLPSTSHTSSILLKIRSVISLKATFPFARIRLVGGVETIWPLNLCFQRYSSKDTSSINKLDYFTFKDGMSSAVKLVSDTLTYKPPPAPSPAIPPAVAAHVTPSNAYHTPPDGATRTKPPTAVQEPTPAVTQTTQDEWPAPTQDGFWPAANESRDEDDFGFGEMDDGFDVREEDFNFFDDEPSGEFDGEETTVAEIPTATEEQSAAVAVDEITHMEDVKLEKEKPPSPSPMVEEPLVLSPPDSPLRILPSPPPTRRSTIPRVWDHVRLSGDLDKMRDKYQRGGKYWCEDLDEHAVTDDSMSTSSSDDEERDWMATNSRKRKRDDDEVEFEKLGPALSSNQTLESDMMVNMIRAVEEHLLSSNVAVDAFPVLGTKTEKRPDYSTEMDFKTFLALVDVVANQVSWDALDASEPNANQQELPLSDLRSVLSSIWGVEAPSNPGLKEWTEINDMLPTFDEEDSPQMKTPRMKVTKSSHSQNNSYSLLNNIEQTQSLYPISSPSFMVHRVISRNPPAPNHIQRLSIWPPALRFWEKLAFSPVSGEKHVRCYVVHPDNDGMSTAVDAFLSELQTAWEGCGMGKFERGKVGKDGKDGMVAIGVPFTPDEESCTSAYQEALVSLGRGISSVTDKWLQNILILMVNPFPSQSVIIPFCRAFMSFKSAYSEGADNPALIPESNLALQIIPASLIANMEGVITRGTEFPTLIRALYDRCGVMAHAQTENKPTTRPIKFLTSPATLLATPPPGNLEFSDTFPVQPRSLLKDNSSMHLAYSISPDDRWVSAVWSDDWGQVSFKESYCLSHLKSPPGGTNQKNLFDNAAARMWLRTAEILKQPKINWRLVIARVGGMSKHEYSLWRGLKESNEKYLPGRVQLVLACVDLHPALEVSLSNSMAASSPLATISTPFPSSMAVFSQASPAAVGNAYGTPVATPLAQTNESPDPSGGIMSTPGGTVNTENVNEFDPEARWIDASDEVWAIVLNHRVPICSETDPETEMRFAAASGFLWPVKSSASDNLIQVHLLHADKPHSGSSEMTLNNFQKDVLKYLLVQYRGLASLGIVRGVSMGEKPVPWHVVAAERINALLTEYM